MCRDQVKIKTMKKISSDFKVAIEVECFPSCLRERCLAEPALCRVLSLVCCFAYEFSVIKAAKPRQIKKSNYK